MPDPQPKNPDPKLDEATIRKYWNPKGTMILPGNASAVMDDVAMTATVDGRTPAAKEEAKQALDHLVKDFPEAAKLAVERLRAAGNDPKVYGDAIKLIDHDMQEHGAPVPNATPKQPVTQPVAKSRT